MAEQLPYKSMRPASGDASADAHLKHLLPPSSTSTPLIVSLIQSVKELINPPKLPPLEITSKPIEISNKKSAYAGNEWKAGLMSLAINGSILGAMLLAGYFREEIQDVIEEKTKLVFAPVPPPPPEIKIKPQEKQTAGGGGQPDPLPESFGKAPKVAPKQFVRPTQVRTENPKLVLEPTVVGAIDLPSVNAPNYGNPFSTNMGAPSLGGGKGTGIGSGNGAGVGPGEGGGFGGGAYKIGGGVTAPTVVTKVEPEYSEEARKAKYQGEVWLEVVVDENGVPQDIRVTRKLGLGLDEKAIEAVRKWRFKAGTKDGKNVAVRATIAVSFHIL